MRTWREALSGDLARDVEQLDRALGVVIGREDLVRALLDPRGQLFQRLEYVGDSILDAVATAELVRLEPWDSTSLSMVSGEQQALVSDHALGRIAARLGLPAVRAFPASRHRLGDRIEAAIGAVWADRGIEAAERAALALVVEPGLHGLPRRDDVPDGTDGARYVHAASRLGHVAIDPRWYAAAASSGPQRRRLAVVGEAIIEAAMATSQYVEEPEADEAQLSEERRSATSNVMIAQRARDLGLERRGDDRTDRRAMADEVQALVGAVAMDGGLGAALEVAAGVLRRSCAPGPAPAAR